jgi:hypothetical protein
MTVTKLLQDLYFGRECHCGIEGDYLAGIGLVCTFADYFIYSAKPSAAELTNRFETFLDSFDA